MDKSKRSYIKKFSALFLFLFSCFLCAIAYNASGLFQEKKNWWQRQPDIFIDVQWPLKQDFNVAASIEIGLSKLNPEEDLKPGSFSGWDEIVKKDPLLKKRYDGMKKIVLLNWQYGRKIGKSNLERLWSENERARKSVVDYAESYVPEKHASIDNTGFAKKMLAGWNCIFRRADYSLFETAQCFMDVSMFAAVERRDFEYAMHADIAWLRAHRAGFYATFYGVPQVWEMDHKYRHQSVDTKCAELLRKIYVYNDAVTEDKKLMAAAEKMLKKRIAFMETATALSEMIKGNEVFNVFQDELDMTAAQKLMRKSLDLWYGDPRSHYIELAGDIAVSEKKGYCGVAETIRKFEETMKNKKTIDRELVDSPDGLLAMLAFLKKAVKIHPLANFAYRQYSGIGEMMLTDSMNDRLLVTASMSRIFFAKNKRWPKYENDADFFKELSIAALDPVDGSRLKTVETSDGGFKIYGMGADCRDDGGDDKKDIVIIVKAPGVK